jgi:hypothetical protein
VLGPTSQHGHPHIPPGHGARLRRGPYNGRQHFPQVRDDGIGAARPTGAAWWGSRIGSPCSTAGSGSRARPAAARSSPQTSPSPTSRPQLYLVGDEVSAGAVCRRAGWPSAPVCLGFCAACLARYRAGRSHDSAVLAAAYRQLRPALHRLLTDYPPVFRSALGVRAGRAAALGSAAGQRR